MRLLTLLTAFAFLATGNGRFTFAVSAWLGPVLLLQFLRNSNAWGGLIAGYAVTVAAFGLAFWGLIPLPPPLYALVVAGFGLALFVPYIADRLLHKKLPPFLATLLFPAALVAVEYLVATFGPYGSWGSIAYTQYGNLPLLQVISVAGPYGVTFLVSWFAPVAAHCWSHRYDWSKTRRISLTYSAVLVGVLMLGSVRLAMPPLASQRPMVRIAAVTAPLGQAQSLFRAMYGVRDEAEFAKTRAAARNLHDELFAMCRREAQAGAKIVFWAECNGLVAKQDEQALIERGKSLARDEGIYLLMALATVAPGKGAYENVVYTADPNGEIVSCYHKARPVPGDTELFSDLDLAIVDTPYGRMAEAICFDMDFPAFIRKAGKSRADFIIVPSKDWPEIDPLHSHMAMLRGIENGCSVVRGVYDGLSMAVDPLGRTLGASDTKATEKGAMVVQVPCHGVRTIYGSTGDLFAWSCCGATLGLFALGIRSRRDSSVISESTGR